jgi:hypothetical protein
MFINILFVVKYHNKMSTIRLLREIDQYFINADIPLLLYGMFMKEVNEEVDRGNNAIIFQFNDPKKFLHWLKTGINNGEHKILCIPIIAALSVIPQKHKHVVQTASETEGSICIMINCLNKNSEIYCSASACMKTTDSSDFDDIKRQYPIHAKSLVKIHV